MANIDAHIGASELKAMAWKRLQPLWLEWSHGFRLSINQLHLRQQKGYVEITKESDAIWDFYWKKKGNAKAHKFDPNVEVSLFLVVGTLDFEKADFHRINAIEGGSGDPNSTHSEVFACLLVLASGCLHFLLDDNSKYCVH